MLYQEPSVKTHFAATSLFLQTQATGSELIPECNENCGQASLGYSCAEGTSIIVVTTHLIGSTIEECQAASESPCTILMDFDAAWGDDFDITNYCSIVSCSEDQFCEDGAIWRLSCDIETSVGPNGCADVLSVSVSCGEQAESCTDQTAQ